MKKTLLAIAVLSLAGSAFACRQGACNVPTKSSSLTTTAGSSVSTGAFAASSGNGSAFSLNSASSFGSASGLSGSTVGNLGNTSTGAAGVSGVAATGGTLFSTSGSIGNAEAGGGSFAEACAEVIASAKYNVAGRDPIAGDVSGSAKSQTGGLAQTYAGIGGGLAVAGGVAGNVGTFEAAAGSLRVGSLVNKSEGLASVTNTSAQLGGDAHVGNATSSIEGWNFGTSSALANAKSGNLCTATSCANVQGKK